MGARHEGADDFHADRDQVQAVERYAARYDVEVEFMPPELSVSGGKPIDERPSLKAAIEGVETGRYSGIVVAYLSRLTRSRSGLQIWERVEAAGGHIHCAAENLDTSTPNGRFIRDIHLANAVREREEHVDRFEARREYATAAGIWQRRQTPRGYRRDPATRKLAPDERADEVRAMFAAKARGEAIVSIARRVGMTPSGVRALLRNRVYLGELKVGLHVNPDAHPALITETEWLAAQATSPARRPRGPDDRVALLAGLIRCAGCGHVMSRQKTKVVVYGCHRNHSAGVCPEPASITSHLVDEYVSDIVRGELQRMQVEASESHAEVDAVRAQIASAEAEMAAYLAGVSAATVGPEAFAVGARLRQAPIDEARARLAELTTRQAALDGVDLIGLWDGEDVEHRNQLLRSAIEAVVVRSAGGRGRRVPVHERVWVIKHGAGLTQGSYSGAGVAMPIRPILIPHGDDEHVLRM